jgi:DNA helicase HerA-like ATPase
LQIESRGGDRFFGEPMLNISDFLQTDDKAWYRQHPGGRQTAELAAPVRHFLLRMLSELFEQVPEIGDADKPKLVFFFDEARLLFDEAPKVLVERLVVRLVRPKGVGVYFVTQNPLDIPYSVLAQLGNRVQHALRAEALAQGRRMLHCRFGDRAKCPLKHPFPRRPAARTGGTSA